MTSNHPFQPDDPEPHRPGQLLGSALRSLLLEKGIYSVEEERAKIEEMQAGDPSLGARLVAKAWCEPEFRSWLLKDGKGASESVGIPAPYAQLIVLENTPSVHNVIVCTLCSCYPRTVLGPQPAWYKRASYRSRVVREPREVLKEFGTHIDKSVELRVHDSSAEMRYMVLPLRPIHTEGWTQEALQSLVTRDAMIGVTRDLTLGEKNQSP